jgi:hypothetical protein
MMMSASYSIVGIMAGGMIAVAALTGCRQAYRDRPIQSLVPQGAVLVAEGRPPVGWLFRGGGSLYILDLDGNALVFSGTFHEISDTPSLIIVDPQERAVIARRIDTEEIHVLVGPIEPAHRFAIYFVPSRQLQNNGQRALPN